MRVFRSRAFGRHSSQNRNCRGLRNNVRWGGPGYFESPLRMLTTKKYSVMIPTFNRPMMLDALLGYFSSKNVKFPIFVLDSSGIENKALNKQAIGRYALNVRHLEFPESIRFYTKVAAALHEIGSEYVSLCADDDVVFVDAIEDCIGEMDRQPDLSACHGIYLNFSDRVPKVDLSFEYSSPSIDDGEVVRRICRLLTRYEALNYAVYRRAVMKNIAELMDAIPRSASDCMFGELISCLVPLAFGKVTRLPRIYYARRANGPTGRMNFHPAIWIAHDPDGFVEAFLEHRKQLFSYLESRGIDVGPGEKKAVTQAYLIYFCQTLRDGSGIKDALVGTQSPLIGLQSGPQNPLQKELDSPPALGLLRKAVRAARKILHRLSPSDVVSFSADGEALTFRSTPAVRKRLSNEMIADLSRIVRASAS
jgi:glycosyltransferase domain-containing protein